MRSQFPAASRSAGAGCPSPATGFAIAGLLYGLRITTQGGDLPDIVYHAMLLPVLIATFALLLRTIKQGRENGEASAPSGRVVRLGS